MTTTHPIRGADHPKQSRTGGTGILPARAADPIRSGGAGVSPVNATGGRRPAAKPPTRRSDAEMLAAQAARVREEIAAQRTLADLSEYERLTRGLLGRCEALAAKLIKARRS